MKKRAILFGMFHYNRSTSITANDLPSTEIDVKTVEKRLKQLRFETVSYMDFSDKNSIDFFISSYNFLNRQYIPVYKGLTVFLISQIHRATEPYPVYLCSQSLYISL